MIDTRLIAVPNRSFASSESNSSTAMLLARSVESVVEASEVTERVEGDFGVVVLDDVELLASTGMGGSGDSRVGFVERRDLVVLL